jgi:hypothetical protein
MTSWLNNWLDTRKSRRGHTVHFALIALITDSTDQLSHALFSVESYGDRLVMMTKQASKCGIWGRNQCGYRGKEVDSYQGGFFA